MAGREATSRQRCCRSRHLFRSRRHSRDCWNGIIKSCNGLRRLRMVPLPRLLARAFHVVGRATLAAKIDASRVCCCTVSSRQADPTALPRSAQEQKLSLSLVGNCDRSGIGACSNRVGRHGIRRGLEPRPSADPWGFRCLCRESSARSARSDQRNGSIRAVGVNHTTTRSNVCCGPFRTSRALIVIVRSSLNELTLSSSAPDARNLPNEKPG
jgi:hypothetical protein